MLQPDPDRPMGMFQTILPPQFIGGAQRAAIAAKQASPKPTRGFWSILFQAACLSASAVWLPQDGRSKLNHLRGALK